MLVSKPQFPSLVPNPDPEQITEQDEGIFWRMCNTVLGPDQEERLCRPEKVMQAQRDVLAVHWHPEHVPIDLAIRRMQAMFPNRDQELVIPTQHNVLLSHAGYSGVEVDCFSRRFNQKVQLLLHMSQEKADKAGVLQSMLEHTRQYRATQLMDLIRTFTQPVQERLEQAARATGADAELIRFITVHVHKLDTLLQKYIAELPLDVVKNKMVRNFFHALRFLYGDQQIDRALNFLQEVKKEVKRDFPLQYFFRTSEIIEEARGAGAGVVVPHPEQFWPILLADYDVDGYEVWNPQSQRYTDFLIDVVISKNRKRSVSRAPLLIFMGDDTHMGEKVREESATDPAKAGREVGYQPAWEDWEVRKRLLRNGITREKVIDAYKSRLRG
jgi:hypothetical protein